MSVVRCAVIPCAGFGTRMLPLSKSIPKELLPLGNKPAIHYVVQEAIDAGIDTIVLVNHAQKTAIDNYLDCNNELDTALRQKGKTALADEINHLGKQVRVISVRQGQALGLGHAVLQGRAAVGNQPFAVLLPDVVLDTAQNLQALIKGYQTTKRSQILVDAVAETDIDKYGIARLATPQIITKDGQNRPFCATGFVEKPHKDNAPSNLAVVGRYVFAPEIFDELAKTEPSVGGEIQLTDAIDTLISTLGVDVMTMAGASFDVGDMASYARAFCHFAGNQGLLA